MGDIQVIPAIIPESYDELAAMLARLRDASSLAHVDVCDGRFVARASWPFAGDRGEWAAVVAQDDGLPLWESFEFEFDLMAANPLALANESIEAGASRVILHLAAPGALDAFDALVADGRAEIWLAGGVGEDLAPHLSRIGRAAGYQQMGIEKIGFQGQPFAERALESVRAVRAAHPDLPIAFDGAVSIETAGAIAGAGASKLVAGSSILKAESARAAARDIRAAALKQV
jgi:ribulose-phosphate 3-epimerase